MNPQGVSSRSASALPLVGAAILALVVQGCVAHGEPEGQGRLGAPAAVPVKTALVQEKALPVTVDALGTVEPRSVVSIRSQVTGQLATVAFEEGAEVKQGDLLFTIDPRPAEVQLEQATAVLARDRTQAASARTTATRYADLLKRGLIPPEQSDQAQAQATALDAAVRADEATVKNAELQKDYTIIRAPVSGRTGALMVQAGNLVRANDTTPLVVINEIAPIYVSFSVPTRELAAVLQPRAARRAARGGDDSRQRRAARGGPVVRGQWRGSDDRHGPPEGDLCQRRPGLWPGQFVQVTLALRTEPNALVVPTEAVLTGQQGTYVFVVKADKTVEMRPVDVERTADAGGDPPWARAGGDGGDRRPAAARPQRAVDCSAVAGPATSGPAMNISGLFIRRPVTTTLVMIAACSSASWATGCCR